MSRLVLLTCLVTLWGAHANARPPTSRPSKSTSSTPRQIPKQKRTKRQRRRKPPPRYESVSVGSRQREDAFRTGRAINLLNQKRLQEKRPRSVPEALEGEAGVFLQKTNHGAGAPIIRGTIGPQVLILMDGIRLNTSTYRSGPNQYLNVVDPWSLQRIEVLRGPASLAYGTQAFGGVISLQSRKAPLSYDPSFNGTLIGRYGSADQERTGRAALGFGIGGFGIRAGVTYSDFGDLRAGGSRVATSNTSLVRSNTPWGSLVTSGATGAQAYTAYRALFVDSHARWQINGSWSLSAAYQRAMLFDAGRADQLNSRGDLRFYDNTRDLGYVRLRANLSSIKTRLYLTLSIQNQEDKVLRPRYDVDTLTQVQRTDRTRDNTFTWGTQLGGQTLIGEWFQLRYGFEHYSDSVQSEASRDGQERTPGFSPGSSYHTLGAFLSGRARIWSWAPQSGLYLRSGVRIGGFLANAPTRANLEAVNFQQPGYAFHAAFQVLLNRYLNVSFSYAEGFRAPNLQEATQLGDTGNAFEVPNPKLRPEVSRSLEMMVRGGYKRRFTAWVSGYLSFWQDLITREDATYRGQSTFEGKPVQRNVNRARADIMGVEAGFRVWLIAGLSTAANLTWTRGLSYLDNGSTEPVSRIPPLFANVSLRYNFGRVGFVEAFVLLADKQDQLSARDQGDVRIPNGGTPGWYTLNLRAAARIHKTLRLTAQLENLLDAPYKYHASGVLGAGLSARISLEGNL